MIYNIESPYFKAFLSDNKKRNRNLDGKNKSKMTFMKRNNENPSSVGC
jgi:hypothetical protein